MSFWERQPTAAAATAATAASQILAAGELLSRIAAELDRSKIKLDYRTVIGVPEEPAVLEFLNANYLESTQSRLQYSDSLVSFFLHDAVTVIFHAKGAPERIIGIICGARTTLFGLAGGVPSLNVNFLCLTPKLRSMHLAPYMIGVLTKESVERFGICVAHYTIGGVIKAPNFGRKQIYHRPLHIRSLVAGGFFDVDVKQYERVYNTFVRVRPVQHIHRVADEAVAPLATEMRAVYAGYSAKAYDVYEIPPFERILTSPAFHTFLFRDDAGKLTDFLSLYRLDSRGARGSYRNGYLYALALSDTRNLYLGTVIETVASHSMKFNIFDMLTLADMLPVKDYGSLKFMKGTGSLGYYMFNMAMPAVENKRNGLVAV